MSALGVDGVRRRLTVRLIVRTALALALLVLLAVGTVDALLSDHGTAVQTQGVAAGQISERSLDNNTNTICHATVRTAEPRTVTRRIVVPCGVTAGQPFPVYLYADNTIGYDDPPNRIQLWVVSYVVGAVIGLLTFLLGIVVGMSSLRLIRWREDR